jgi:nucleotide-binding universal stress UspA family protein
MFERILVPLDGSVLAEAILGQVRRLLFHKDAEILLVRAVTMPRPIEAGAVELPAILMSQAKTYLAGIVQRLSSQGARVRSLVREGDAPEVLIDIAQEERATLIAMSTHGRTGLARWALGSVAERVLRASPVPVLALRSFTGTHPNAVPARPDEVSLGRILVPVDAAELSLDVVPAARELARLFGSQVFLLHVCEGPACSVSVPQMTRAYEEFHAAGVQAEPLMKHGDPAGQILDTAEERGADLIAMATHGRTGTSRWMLGSVTERVLRSSHVPLLVVRGGKMRAEMLGGRLVAERAPA